MFNILVIIGSLRKESFNKRLMLALDKLNHPLLKFHILDLHTVPLYNQDDEANMPAPAAHLKKRLKNRMVSYLLHLNIIAPFRGC